MVIAVLIAVVGQQRADRPVLGGTVGTTSVSAGMIESVSRLFPDALIAETFTLADSDGGGGALILQQIAATAPEVVSLLLTQVRDPGPMSDVAVQTIGEVVVVSQRRGVWTLRVAITGVSDAVLLARLIEAAEAWTATAPIPV